MSDIQYYVQLTEQEAESIIIQGMNQLFSGKEKTFDNYTHFLEDNTGNKYYKIQDLLDYKIIDWFKTNFPDKKLLDKNYIEKLTKDSEP